MATATQKKLGDEPTKAPSIDALNQARAALASGNLGEAVRKAQRSIKEESNLAAQLLLTELRCRQKDLGNARTEWEKLPKSLQRKAERECQKHEVDLSL
ncbi:hypothetical protein D7V88_28145 [Corallococcus terminator]|uniref:Uncharacterized protein n=1 Tax=Corallococcus terminator TaxID=2316733 RepID=A0A3A8I9C7_9BACT|nr:hypothetical protein D7V88_28145 [Corallococcus terminator]